LAVVAEIPMADEGLGTLVLAEKEKRSITITTYGMVTGL
jgi:ABC-type nitrate/sulfonate/bicarbonate transport system permease component